MGSPKKFQSGPSDSIHRQVVEVHRQLHCSFSHTVTREFVNHLSSPRGLGLCWDVEITINKKYPAGLRLYKAIYYVFFGMTEMLFRHVYTRQWALPFCIVLTRMLLVCGFFFRWSVAKWNVTERVHSLKIIEPPTPGRLPNIKQWLNVCSEIVWCRSGMKNLLLLAIKRHIFTDLNRLLEWQRVMIPRGWRLS